MVKHIFLTCGVLLLATAQTAFAKELEGMLVTQNNYVRIRSCDLKNNYTLLPGSGNGYEAAAEIISVRKNTPENTPIYVRLRGNLENTNFLIPGLISSKWARAAMYRIPKLRLPKSLFESIRLLSRNQVRLEGSLSLNKTI